MKIINAKVHGVVDYIVVMFLWLSPSLFGLSDLVGKLTYALGLVHLTLTLVTNFPMGVFKILPLKFHGYVELVVSFILIGTSFFLQGVDMFFYAAFGLAVLATWSLTDYKSQTS